MSRSCLLTVFVLAVFLSWCFHGSAWVAGSSPQTLRPRRCPDVARRQNANNIDAIEISPELALLGLHKTEEQQHFLKKWWSRAMYIGQLCHDHWYKPETPHDVGPDLTSIVWATQGPFMMQAGETLLEEGTVTDTMYLIQHGEFDVLRGGEKLKTTALAGRCFGELSLMTGYPNSASIVAASNAIYWTLEKEAYRTALTPDKLESAAITVFELYEIDDNGFIPIEEMSHALRTQFEEWLSFEDIIDLTAFADKDETGMISLPEFLKMLKTQLYA